MLFVYTQVWSKRFPHSIPFGNKGSVDVTRREEGLSVCGAGEACEKVVFMAIIVCSTGISRKAKRIPAWDDFIP